MFDPNQLLNTMLSSGTRGSPMSDLLAGLSEGGAAAGARPGAMGGASGAGPLGDLLGGLMGGAGLGGNQPGGGLGGGSGSGGGLADLLGGLLGGGGMAGGGGMPGGSVGGGGMGGGLGDLLGGMLGGGRAGGMGGSGMGGSGGLGDLLGGLLGGGGQAPAAPRGGGILDGLLGGLFGGRGGPSKTSGLALIAALAMTLLQSRTGGAAAGAVGAQPAMRAVESIHDVGEAAVGEKALQLIRAMIAAAKADGQIDAEERGRILGKLREAGADAEALAFVEQEMQRPLDVEAVVAGVTDEQTAAEVFLASMFAINVDTSAEKAYLAQLADRLGLQAPSQA